MSTTIENSKYPDPLSCAFCDSGLVFTLEEQAAIAALANRLELSGAAVIRQALRLYQMRVLGNPDIGTLSAPQPAPDTEGQPWV